MAARLNFPIMMTLALFAGWLMLRLGVHPGAVALIVLVPVAGIIALLERLLPYRAEWNRMDGDVATDFLHMIIAQIIMPRLLGPVFAAVSVTLAVWLARRYGGTIWPTEWPVLLQLFLMLLIAEFGRYWVHRASHTVPLLWRFHAVHHSPNRLYWMNAGRFHPLEKTLFLIPEVVPFILLGTSGDVLVLYFIFNGLHGMYQHSNIEVTLGPLNYLFSMTELHRWHHSKLIVESNTNYGNNLSVWDWVFGTFYWPKDRQVGAIGLIGDRYPKDYLGQLTAPFHREALDKPVDYDEVGAEAYEARIRAETAPVGQGGVS